MIIELGLASEETKGIKYTATNHDAPGVKKIDADGDRCRSGSPLQDVVTEANRVKDPN